MPETTENFIRIPIRKISEFVEGSFKTIDISNVRGIKAIIGKLKSDPSGPTKVKTYLFDKEKWTLETATAWVKENKSMKFKKQYLTGYVEKAEENGIISVAIATDESVDRDNERIKADGWDFKNFKKNPVLLWAHDYRQMPIGKVLDIRREGKKILFKPQFAIDESRKAREIFELYKGGFLNTFSVGFIPKEWEMEKKGEQNIRVYTKTEMLEISAVPVPSNANAVVVARSKGLDNDLIDEMEDNIENIKTTDTEDTGAEGGESKAIINVKTGETNGHTHIGKFDDETGNGATSEANGHKHSIRDFRVLETNDHTHSMARKSNEGDEKKECENCKKLEGDIETLKKSIAENKTVNGGGSPVESLGVLLKNPKATKRLLQEVDKHVGEALGKLKRAGIK